MKAAEIQIMALLAFPAIWATGLELPVRLEELDDRWRRPWWINVPAGMYASDHRRVAGGRIESANRATSLPWPGGVINLAIGVDSLLLQVKRQDWISLSGNHDNRPRLHEVLRRPQTPGADSQSGQSLAALCPEQI